MHLTQISYVVMTQIIDCLPFETRPCPLRNFRVAKSTSFLFNSIPCTLHFTHMQSLTANFFYLYLLEIKKIRDCRTRSIFKILSGSQPHQRPRLAFRLFPSDNFTKCRVSAEFKIILSNILVM